jgi:hypothetical protein
MEFLTDSLEQIRSDIKVLGLHLGYAARVREAVEDAVKHLSDCRVVTQPVQYITQKEQATDRIG